MGHTKWCRDKKKVGLFSPEGMLRDLLAQSVTTAVFVVLASAWTDAVALAFHAVIPEGKGLLSQTLYATAVTGAAALIMRGSMCESESERSCVPTRRRKRRATKGFVRVPSDVAV